MSNMDDNMMHRRFLSRPPLGRPLTTVLAPSTQPENIEHAPVVPGGCMDWVAKEVAADKSIPVAPPRQQQELTGVHFNVSPCVNPKAAGGRNGMLMQNDINQPPGKMDFAGFSNDFLQENLPTLEEAMKNEKSGRKLDRDEEKRLRRTISNRLSAQRARVKKSLYIAEMKKRIKELEDSVAYLNPALETFRQKQTMLKNQKTFLEQQLRRCINQSIISNRQIEENRAEITRLKELLALKMEHMRMMNGNEIGIPNSSLASFAVKPPESHNLTDASSTGFNGEQMGALLEGMNDIDHGGIEQYLNLDALGLSPSTQFSQG